MADNVKKAILNALVDGALNELMVKTTGDRGGRFH